MNLGRDFSHLMKVARYGLKTLPSRATEKDKFRRLQQIAWRRAKAGVQNYYPGADTGAIRGDWAQTIVSNVSIVRSEFTRLCARSELAYRTDTWSKRAIQILCDFIVGQGIKPYPAIKKVNGEINETAVRILAQDWQRFNDEGIRNGTQQITAYEGQRVEFKTIAVYGNSLANVVSARRNSWLPYAFQFIKPTRLDFSKDNYFDSSNYEAIPTKQMIVHGIEINSFGEPVNFYIQGIDKPFPASRMSIGYFPTETEQYLGLPWLTPVLDQVWDNQQIFSDKLKQSRIGSRLGYKIAGKDRAAMDEAIDETADDGTEYIDLDFQGFVSLEGKLEPVKLDDSIKDSFLPLVQMNLTAIAAGLGFSYQLLTTDLSKASFSASRANGLSDNRAFRAIFKWFTKTILQRRWEKFVEWEILSGKVQGVTYQNFLNDPWFYTQCYWLPMDGEEYVDPLKDAEAIKLLYGLGQITYQEICSMAGKDYMSTLKQLQKERELMTAMKLEYLLPNNLADTGARRQALVAQPEEGDNNVDTQ